jgi:hypothetical protein
MTADELRETEYRGYVARLANQRDALAIACYKRAALERECAALLEEINIIKRRMRPYEELDAKR